MGMLLRGHVALRSARPNGAGMRLAGRPQPGARDGAGGALRALCGWRLLRVATRSSKGVACQLWLERQAGGSPRSPQRAGADPSAFRRGRQAPLDEPTPPVPPSNSVIALKINNLRDMSRPPTP